MSTAIVTGSSGLVGSETVQLLHEQGMDVIGIDNDFRRYYFGEDGSTRWKAEQMIASFRRYRHIDLDIRDQEGIYDIFRTNGRSISLIVHSAAQPSHDWAAREPITDFTVNAQGTMLLLEATRLFAPDAVFILTSTNKVYGDTPNRLPVREQRTRWELDPNHTYAANGIDESMSIDNSMHSLFGVSKTAADLAAQEYGRYFGLKTGVFRGGCLTGSAHSGAELHGFLAYLVKCAVTGRSYTIYGYKGKQVRDNLHSLDLASAFWQFFRKPSEGAVYNMGGGRETSCSVLEAIEMAEELCGRSLDYSIEENARAGDHIWWITDVTKFRREYPEWEPRFGLSDIMQDLVEAARTRGSKVKT